MDRVILYTPIYIYIQGEISFHLKHEIKEVVTYEVTNLCVLLVL